MNLELSITASEIPQNTDPIIELIPILQSHGFTLVGNGVSSDKRFLIMEFPEGKRKGVQ